MHHTSPDPSDPTSSGAAQYDTPARDTTAQDTTQPAAQPAAAQPQARRSRQERGATLVEYALLIALIAVVLASAVTMVGNTADTSLNSSASRIEAAG